ncbi:FAD-dependent monooxygenase [Granulicella sp. S156]|uniref:FAD-dependent monooxygenase n=1 Tax=Granulicella sp. S156 TaxID=1747224 RepID=UPI00131E8DB8|nr:FAD-dependent monooxygenase [Granulicella sp. S156]
MNCDVVIAGAGPVGLLLAAELKLAGVSVIVLERLTELDMTIKAGGIRGNSTKLLARRGLWPLLQAEAAKYSNGFASVTSQRKDPADRSMKRFGSDRSAGRFAGHFAGLLFPLSPKSPMPSNTPMPQQALEQVLGAWLEELDVTVLRGHEITGFAQDQKGVDVYSVTAEGAFDVHASYLVGCDGGRSTVRKLAGFDFPGTDPLTTGYQAIVSMDNPDLLPLGWNLTETGLYHYGAKPGWLFFLEFCGPPPNRDAPLTTEELESSLRRVSGKDVTITGIEASTRFTDNARQAATYRMGRVLLAGDAAHIHPPLGGHGINLGLEDAANLGWKLAAVVQGWAPEGLLDSYTTERHPVAAAVLTNTRAQISIMRPDAHSRAMRELFGELIQTTPWMPVRLGNMMQGRGIRYEMGSDQHPLVGKPVPDISGIDDAMRLPRPVLFDLSGSAGLRTAVDGWTDRVDVRALTVLTNLGALLVRPDGFVAWAVDGEVKAGDLISLREALTRWLGEPKGQSLASE